MAQRKPGRVLFWIAVASWAAWWLMFALDFFWDIPAGRDGTGLLSFLVAAVCTVLWLKVKWISTKARAVRAGLS